MAVTLDDPIQDLLVDVFSVPTERLEAAIVALAAEANATRYRLFKLLAAYDQRGAWVAAWTGGRMSADAVADALTTPAA